MKIAKFTKSSIILGFMLGITLSAGMKLWENFIAPYIVPPLRPDFSQVGDTLFQNRPNSLPLAKFTPPPRAFVPSKSEVKYQGRVNVARGLVLRKEPKAGADRTGGVEYNANVSVLRETPDREWVFLRVDSTKETGWVRSGNIFRN